MGIKTVDIKNKVTARLKHVAGAWGYGIFDADGTMGAADDIEDILSKHYGNIFDENNYDVFDLIVGYGDLWQKPLKVGQPLIKGNKDTIYTSKVQKEIADRIQKKIKKVFPYVEKPTKAFLQAEKLVPAKQLEQLFRKYGADDIYDLKNEMYDDLTDQFNSGKITEDQYDDKMEDGIYYKLNKVEGIISSSVRMRGLSVFDEHLFPLLALCIRFGIRIGSKSKLKTVFEAYKYIVKYMNLDDWGDPTERVKEIQILQSKL